MTDRLYRDKAWLTEQYLLHRRTMRSIAAECNTSPETVRKWLAKFKIKKRGSGPPLNERRVQEVYNFIREYKQRYAGHSPTFRAITFGTSIPDSTTGSMASHYVTILQERGLATYIQGVGILLDGEQYIPPPPHVGAGRHPLVSRRR